jgi:hypothetical protein
VSAVQSGGHLNLPLFLGLLRFQRCHDLAVPNAHRILHGPIEVLEVLRLESGPIESLSIANKMKAFHLLVRTRPHMPKYTVRGDRLRGVLYGEGDIPVEQQVAELPETAPGGKVKIEIKFGESGVPLCVRFDVFRPRRFLVFSLEWKP